MNFAVLSKLKLSVDKLDKLLEQIKTVARPPRVANLAEIAFYRSSQSIDEMYVLSFWFELDHIQQVHNLINAVFSKDNDVNIEIIESKNFQLDWEYRLLTQLPAASHIRLLTFPDGYPEDKARAVMDAARIRRPKIAGLVGSWIGRCLDNPQLTLQRVDWISEESLEAFFCDKSNQELIASRLAQGIRIEYASRNLERFIEPLREPLTNLRQV